MPALSPLEGAWQPLGQRHVPRHKFQGHLTTKSIRRQYQQIM